MNLLHCATCNKYFIKGQFDIATRQNGRLIEKDGAVGVRLGSRSLPDQVPWARVQAAVCLDCGGPLELVDLPPPCPHAADEQYWHENLNAQPPIRKCELCGVKQEAIGVIWPS